MSSNFSLPHQLSSNEDIAPCLGILMPVFNEEATIERVVNLVLAQRPVKELVVVDDCSTDGTFSILKGLASKDSRIRLFYHEKNILILTTLVKI